MKIDNRYIQKEADDLLKSTLRNLFQNHNMSLGEHQSKEGEEKGIDYFFEVFREKGEHVLLVLNQNKGTFDGLKIIKKKGNENFGKISYKLEDLRHADYFYYQLDDPLIFTVCDLENKKVYWYDIQNDNTLPERIAKQKEQGKNSIQLYISTCNILNEGTFDRLLKQIDYSMYNQRRKKEALNKDIEADYMRTQDKTENKNIIDKIIYALKLFEGISVLPTIVITQLYPFKGTERRTYISGYNFYTDNEEFFDFMNTISLCNDELQLNNNIIYVENQKEKLLQIVKFFQVNHISHLRWGGSNPKGQICLHNLFQYKKCDCERCNFDRLNYKRTKELLQNNVSNTYYEVLRKGYTYYLMGDYVNSACEFLKVYKTANKTANPISYTISTYNLIKLRGLIEFSFYGSNKYDILKQLELIRFVNDEQFVMEHAPYFLDVYRDIKEKKFYNNVRNTVDNLYWEIQKKAFEDKTGTWHSQNDYSELESSFHRFNSYLEHNFIIFNYYREYGDLSKKVLECFIALYSLKNPVAQRLKKFDWYMLELWIFNIDEVCTRYLIHKYDIKKIKIYKQPVVVEKLNELIDNLILSKDCVKELTGMFKPIKPQNILNSIVIVSQLIDIPFEDKKQILFKVLDFCESNDNIYHLPDNGLINFVWDKEDLLSKDELKRILDILFLDNSWKFGLGRIINMYVNKCNETEILQFIKEVLKIDSINDIDFEKKEGYLQYLFYAFTLLGENLKNELGLLIQKSLKKKFDDKLYDTAIIFDLIEFDETLFKRFVDTVPDMSNVDNNEGLSFGNFENIRINQVINICYKYGLEFDEGLRKLCDKAHCGWKDYFAWLMDIDGFDYIKFKHYWVLEYQTIYYYDRFRKSEILKKEIVQALNSDYIEGVAKLYFKHLIQNT